MKRLLIFCLMYPLSISTIFGQKTAQSSVFFDTDKAILRPQAQATLHRLADSVKQLPQYALRLQGHTDADGSDAYNQNLSERRTDAVRHFLINEGIAAEKITIAALGETQPMANNTSEDGKQRNRRVDITLESARLTTTGSNISPFEKGKTYHIMRLYKELSLTPQTFVLKSNQDTVIRGDKGTQLHFPANAFAGVAEGTPVEIKLKECYDYASILAEHLTTKSGDNLLQTGGMIYVQALANGKELTLQKPMDIVFSSAESKLKGMQLFTGERKMENKGAMNWQPLNPRREDPISINNGFNDEDNNNEDENGVYLKYYLRETTAPMSYILDLTDTDSLFEAFTVYGKVVNPKTRYRPRSTSFAGNSMGVYACQYTEFMTKNKFTIHRGTFNDVYKFYGVETYEALSKQDTSLWNKQYREKIGKIQAAKIQERKDKWLMAKMDVASTNAFFTAKLAWINCDRYVSYPENQLVSLNITEKASASCDVKIVLKKDKVVIGGFAVQGQPIAFGRVLKNTAAIIVAMKIENGQSYLAMHDFITSAEPIDLKFEALSPEQIKERLKKLN